MVKSHVAVNWFPGQLRHEGRVAAGVEAAHDLPRQGLLDRAAKAGWIEWMRRACSSGLVWSTLAAASLFTSGVVGQTPPIEILRSAPNYTPPGVPLCPIANPPNVDDAFYEPRVSGVWGFTDYGPPSAPFATPREYAVGGRGDGLILLDATPPSATNARATAASMAGNYMGFLPDLRQFAPHNLLSPYPVPPQYNPPSGWPASAGSQNLCGTGAPGNGYSPWRECAVLYDAGNDHYYVYSVDGGRNLVMPNLPGIWVVRLIRGANGQLQLPPANGGVQGLSGVADFQQGHNIVADQSSGLIVVVENNWTQPTERVNVYSVAAPGSYLAPVLLYSMYDNVAQHAHPHDAHFKDGKLWVSLWGMRPAIDGWVDEYSVASLQGTAAPVPLRTLHIGPSSSGIQSAHSLAVDGSVLWVMQEDQGWNAGWSPFSRMNLQTLDLTRQVQISGSAVSVSPAPSSGAFYPVPSFYPTFLPPGVTPAGALLTALQDSQASFGSVVGDILMAIPPMPIAGVPFVGPTWPSQGTCMSMTAHQLRAVGKTGFLSHYCDGFDVVDMTKPGEGMTVLSSLDTAQEVAFSGAFNYQGASVPTMNTTYSMRGCYDLWPHADSGLVYLADGVQGLRLARINEGHLNRFWNPTPFPPGSASPGWFPRLECRFGPLRSGTQFILSDSNRSQLQGGAVYSYSVYASLAEPVQPTSGPTHQWNLDPVQSLVFPPTGGAYGNDMFVFPASLVPARGVTIYFQMVVEEMAVAANGDYVSYVPPRKAASRGAWIGVAR